MELIIGFAPEEILDDNLVILISNNSINNLHIEKRNCLKCKYYSETADYDICDSCMWNTIFEDFFEKKNE